ncbi:MAG: hypothetical protein U0573_03445 [Phycisphaerales bacterium]
MMRVGRFGDSVALLDELQRVEPRSAACAGLLAEALTAEGKFDRALYQYERLLTLRPMDAVGAIGVLHVLSLAMRKEEAVRRGAELSERFGRDARFVLFRSSALVNAGHAEEAALVVREAMRKIGPDPSLAGALGSNLLTLGRAAEAERTVREALEHSPGNPNLQALLASALHYLKAEDGGESLALHTAIGRTIESAWPVIDPLSFENVPDPERVLRVGLLSADLRSHAVSRFVEGILQHHDRSRVWVGCFHVFPSEDEVTRRFRAMSGGWFGFREKNPRLVAQEVWNQKIDVLIELGGLSGNSLLPVMVPRVAPVQASAIGYPDTTGLSVMDYRLVDSLTDPPGEAERRSREKLERLDPYFLCYTPDGPLPALGADRTGEEVVFGSFNKLAKHSDAALVVWKRILDALPRATLFIKSGVLGNAQTREAFLERLGSAGISPERVRTAGFVPSAADHLSAYNGVDIALDTFPYNGTTTTCEALVMGVPVVAMEGLRHAGRVGLSLLTAAGLSDCIVRAADAYVEKAVELARARPSRAELRARVLSSALCDGPAYAARWEAAVRRMWRSWCERRHGASR